MSGPNAADGVGGAGQGGRRSPRHLDADGLYTVQSGDSLAAIARDLLGDAKRYNELAAANGIADPKVLPAYTHGKPTRLKIPNGATAAPSPAPSGPPSPEASAPPAKAADPDWMPPKAGVQQATAPAKPDDFKPRPLPVPMNTNYPPLDPGHLPHTGPAAALAHRAAPGPASLDPLELVKLVKNGDVDLTVPIPAGPLGSGSTKVTAAPGTVVKLTVHVANGQLDFAKTKVSFQPSLKAPAGLSVKGAYLDSKGDLGISLSGVLSVFGDVHLKTQLPPDLPGLIKKIQDEEGKPLSTRMGWLIPLGDHPVIPKFDAPKVELPGDPPAQESSAPPPNSPTAKAAAPAPDFKSAVLNGNTVISIRNVEFAGGTVNLGSAGTVTLNPGTKIDISGTTKELSVHIDARKGGIAHLNVDSGGTRLEGIDATADITATFRHPNATGPYSASTSISDLNMTTQYAVSERANGDYIALANGKIENGSIKLEETADPSFHLNKPTMSELKIGKFSGTIDSAKLTVPDGKHTSQVTIGPSTFSGDMSITPAQILAHGSIDVRASIQNFDAAGPKGVGVDVNRLDIHGRGQATYDSNLGFTMTKSALKVQADIRKATVVNTKETLTTQLEAGSQMDLAASELQVTKDHGVHATGRGNVDLRMDNMSLGRGGFQFTGDTADIRGSADVEIDSGTGVKVSHGNLSLDAALKDGRVQIGEAINLHFKPGTQLHTALADAAFGHDGSHVQMRPGTKIDAVLQDGKIVLPGGRTLDIKDGARVSFQFKNLELDKGGYPQATGSMQLDVDLEAGQLDMKSLAAIGLTPMKGFKQHMVLDLGKFVVNKDGTFQVGEPDPAHPGQYLPGSGLTASIQAQIDGFGGKLPDIKSLRDKMPK